MTALRLAKSALRKELKTALCAIPADERLSRSRNLVVKLLSSAEYQKSRRIAVYLSMADEVETRSLLEDIFTTGRTAFIPRYHGDQMEMLRLTSMEDLASLPRTKWNIQQPAIDDTSRENPLETGGGGLDLIVVPGLGFTLSGKRLGRGAGYYDRYLDSCCSTAEADGSPGTTGSPVKPATPRRPLLVAMALAEQLRDNLPTTPEDYLVDRVIVEAN